MCADSAASPDQRLLAVLTWQTDTGHAELRRGSNDIILQTTWNTVKWGQLNVIKTLQRVFFDAFWWVCFGLLALWWLALLIVKSLWTSFRELSWKEKSRSAPCKWSNEEITHSQPWNSWAANYPITFSAFNRWRSHDNVHLIFDVNMLRLKVKVCTSRLFLSFQIIVAVQGAAEMLRIYLDILHS